MSFFFLVYFAVVYYTCMIRILLIICLKVPVQINCVLDF